MCVVFVCVCMFVFVCFLFVCSFVGLSVHFIICAHCLGMFLILLRLLVCLVDFLFPLLRFGFVFRLFIFFSLLAHMVQFI